MSYPETGQTPSGGQASAAHVARPAVVGRTLVKQAPVLLLVPLIPGAGALIEGERELAAVLMAPAAGLALLAVVSRGLKLDDDMRRLEAVVALALVFVISALSAMPAFVILGMDPLDAFFEAVSGITTTGLSVAEGTEEWPISAHLLRAWMQWCGGVVVAVAGLALLMGAGRATRMLGRASVGEANYLSSTREKARMILVGYAALTVIGVAGAAVLIPGWWEGPLVALAAVSTGGFTPRPTSLAEYSLGAQVFVMTLCVAGALSLLLYALLRELHPREALRNGTVHLTLGVIAGGLCLYAVAHVMTQGWDPEALIAGMLNHVSAQTTAGFSAEPVLSAGPPVVLLIVAMMVGGDVGSTTGGLKMARVATLVRMVGYVFLRLRLPDRAVVHLKAAGQRVETDQVIFAAALLAIYLFSALVVWLVLLAAGHGALPALFDAVSALSGVGLSSGVIGPELEPGAKVLTILAMLLGRLEFFAFILLFLPTTWFHMR